MQSAAYQAIFKSRLRYDTTAKGKWMTEEGGGYMSAGAGGAFTGKGFKIGIIDDLFKNREEAESKTIRDSRWNWYLSSFYTRQEGATAIIVISTRSVENTLHDNTAQFLYIVAVLKTAQAVYIAVQAVFTHNQPAVLDHHTNRN